MTAHRVIALIDHRQVAPNLSSTTDSPTTPGPWMDTLHRPLRDLRISVTDRCNFRCSYCMPKHVFGPQHVFLPQSELLSFEEITRTAQIFVAHGVQKIRLTGGEPLLRKHIERLIQSLSQLRTPEGQPVDLTLTTNGSALAAKAQLLKDAGLQRITVSLDALDDATFRHMNDADFPVSSVLAGLHAAQQAGFSAIKVNMVVKRGTNDDQILPMARHFKGSGVVLRFIEYMDVGSTNGWRLDEVLPAEQLIAHINAHLPLRRLPPHAPGETAVRYQYVDGSGELGVIASVSQAFCASCTRARLSTEGKLFLCLFATQGHDVRALLRSGLSDAQISAQLGLVWQQRADRYSELRQQHPTTQAELAKRVEMHYIGG
jgi:GTP 3',8-cyclase